MRTWILSLFLTIGSSITVYAQPSYAINGNVPGLTGELYLVTYDGIKIDTLGSVRANAGQFSFTGQVDDVTYVSILMTGGQFVAELMLENTGFNVLSEGIVTGGGEAQKLLAQFNALNFDLIHERKSLEDEFLEAEKKGDKKKMQEIDARFQKFLVEMQARELKLLEDNADTYVAAYVVASTMLDIDPERLKKRYNLLGERAKATSFGKAIVTQIEKYKQVEVGSIAPNFKFSLSKGVDISLHEIKARVKILCFWASVNAESRNENVNLLKMYQQFHMKGLEIISLSIDDFKSFWQKAMGEDGITWPSALLEQNSEILSLYCIQNVPAIFVLDSENRIVAKNLQSKALYDEVNKLLKEK